MRSPELSIHLEQRVNPSFQPYFHNVYYWPPDKEHPLGMFTTTFADGKTGTYVPHNAKDRDSNLETKRKHASADSRGKTPSPSNALLPEELRETAPDHSLTENPLKDRRRKHNSLVRPNE